MLLGLEKVGRAFLSGKNVSSHVQTKPLPSANICHVFFCRCYPRQFKSCKRDKWAPSSPGSLCVLIPCSPLNQIFHGAALALLGTYHSARLALTYTRALSRALRATHWRPQTPQSSGLQSSPGPKKRQDWTDGSGSGTEIILYRKLKNSINTGFFMNAGVTERDQSLIFTSLAFFTRRKLCGPMILGQQRQTTI